MLPPLQAIVRVRARLDGAAVQRAWEKLTAAYPVLAIRIGQVAGEDGPLQIVGDEAAGFHEEPGPAHGDAERIEARLRVLADRERGLIDSAAPRARLALVAGVEDTWLAITVAPECCDTSSLTVLIGQLFDACESGAPPSGEEIDYFQYAEWQHNVMREADASELSAYWHAQLNEGANPLSFMPRIADPHVVRAPAIAARTTLPDAIVAALQSLSARLAVSPAQIVLASVACVLRRLTGMDALSVGWTFNGRTTTELEHTVGPLDQVLPVTLRVAADDTVASLIRRVRERVEEAADRQDFVNWSDLYDSVGDRGAILPFSMEWLVLEADAGPHAGPHAGYEIVELRGGDAAYEVRLTIAQRGAQLEAWWAYAPDRVDAVFVEHLSTQWLGMLHRFVADGDTALADIPVSHAIEHRRLVDELAGRPVSVPGERSILDLIDEQVRERADAIALRGEDVCLTYAAFDRRVRRVASAMRAYVAEGLVGIDATFGADAIVLMVAAMKAGLTYVPVDPQQPAERLAALANEDGSFLVFGTRSEPPWQTGRIRYVALDVTAAGTTAAMELPNVAPQAPAYVILTSGSTGTPKGVTISHESLARSTFARLAYYPEPVERFLLLSPLHVDSSVAGIYWTLVCGGELLLPSDTGRRDPEHIGELVRSSQISHLLCIPSLYKLVLEALRADRPGALRAAIVAAEPCPRELVSRHALVMPETILYNEYGPSEATVWASVLACQGLRYAKIPIGQPAPHVSVYVLEGRGATTAIGETGEIHLGGAIASGYWRNPRETARGFVPDALSGAAGAVLYRSGDYGAWHADGSLAFSGRRDDQVKILGFRVELAEVREAIESHAAIKEACVRFLPERGELAAYVVPAGQTVADVGALLTPHLRGCLPRFMHPHHWIVLTSLPKLPGGKIDTHKLPPPALASASAASLPALEDPLESLVASIWQQYLPGRAIGRGDSFFALGGNSLNGIQVVSRLQDALQTDVVGIHLLFECPVLSDFTRELHRRLAQRLASAPLTEEPMDSDVDVDQPDAPAPASFFQERLFFLHLLDPGGSAYNCPFAIRFEGQIDAASVQACLRRLQETHAALRTTLRMRDGVLHQEAGVADITLRQVDLRSSDGGVSTGPSSDIDALVLQEGGTPFHLDGGALFRATLFTLDSNTSVLVAVVHHAVFDGWSLRILVSDFMRLYAERHAGAAPRPSAPVLTYATYSRWQRRQWDRGAWRDQLHYWTEHLRDAAGLLAIPTDKARREGQEVRGDTLHFEWPASIAERVRQTCRDRNITTFMFFEALLALVLHRYSGQADVLIGTPIANRRRPTTENVIGPVANTLVVRNAFAASQTWNDLLAQVRSTVVQAYCNQDVPFEKVVEALQPVRTLAASPLFQVMFVMQNVPVEPFELEGLRCEVMPHRARTAKFDLTLSLFDRTPEIKGQLEYNSALFDRETMARLIRNLERALTSVLDEPHAPVERVDVISELEKQLLRGWNPVPVQDESETLVSLCEAQVARAPDAIAVSFDGAALTYAALDRQANQLANHLTARGVTPDTPVAVIAERSLELVISLLGIIKAGCAYLPLDCDAPEARLQRIWTRAGRPHTITDTRRAHCAFLEDREICWAADSAAIAQAPIDPPRVRVGADQLAYVIYTSGSTGEPKGVMVPHRGIVNRLRWMQRELELSPQDVVLQKTPYTFDVSVWEFFWPLLEGARLALVPPGSHKDPDALQRLLWQEQVSYTHFVPSMLGAFMQFRRFEELRALRGVVCSGEALDAALCERFFDQARDTRLYNMYGPTEASVDVSSWPCRAGEDSVPIGRPIDGAQLHIASAAHAHVPLGGAGELLIGGVGLARGYWADPRTTARAFIPDHRSGVAGARLYRSGDLARYRGDGAIEFLGRSDGQIKLRGIRIELGEIEHALRTFEGVADVAAIARGAGTPDARIVAYVTGIRAEATDDLRQHAATVLPAYMTPADIVVLEHMPTLSSGKVDRASLASRELPRHGPAVAHVPAGDTERRLAGPWMHSLRLDAIDATASFFAAGGHSLAAIALLAELNREFGINLGLPVLLESRSFVDLAARIDGLRHLRDSRAAWSGSRALGEVEGAL